jgi:glyoxylase-like metal-dependent hydrolase (beta-lactamase superfamily II)
LSNRIKATLPTWNNAQRFDGDKELVPGVQALATPGHTPGLTSYLVRSGNELLIVLGDVTNIPALFVKNPGWHAVFDVDAPLAETNRRKMFDRVVADKTPINGLPGAGTIQKRRQQLRLRTDGVRHALSRSGMVDCLVSAANRDAALTCGANLRALRPAHGITKPVGMAGSGFCSFDSEIR